MIKMKRRQWLTGLAAGAAGVAVARRGSADSGPSPTTRVQAQPPADAPLALKDFQPKSMLRVPVHTVGRAKFPVIDVHTHLSRSDGTRYLATPQELLEVMDRKNVRTMVNLTGGTGAGLASSIKQFETAAPGRFVTFTEPSWSRLLEPGYPQWQAGEIEKAKNAGARGLKVLKTLGLFLRERGKEGPLLKVDDARFDPVWDACGRLGLPVAIHVSDPQAFFLATDRHNERYEELSNHPDWSFHGRDYPGNAEILEARNRVFARHPRTQFIVLHVGNNAEDLAYVSESLDRFKNTVVEIGARVGELGRQPRAARRFFDRYQDRILFGTDAVPRGVQTPQQIFGDELYEIYYRFLETEDEYFDYAPAPVPPQGRWRIYGIGLPDAILKRVYHDNAARVLRLPSL